MVPVPVTTSPSATETVYSPVFSPAKKKMRSSGSSASKVKVTRSPGWKAYQLAGASASPRLRKATTA